MTTTVPMGRRLTDLAESTPDKPALIHHAADGTVRSVTYAELEVDSNRIARLMVDRAIGPSTLVTIGLRDEPLHVAVTMAAWKVGACVLPMSPRLPARERAGLLELAGGFRPVRTVGRWTDGAPPDIHADDLVDLDHLDDSGLPDVIASPGHVLGSGGTSGRPKITVGDAPAVVVLDDDGTVVTAPLMVAMNVRQGQTRLICTPMYHTNGFGMTSLGIAMGDTVVLFEKFDAPRILDAIEAHLINQFVVVPVVLQRLAEVPGIEDRDLSSLVAVGYGGAPCPEWVTRKWIDLIGAEHLFHGFGATEGIGKTALRADEWLKRPGSCGLPLETEVRILDEGGRVLPAGEVGEIFMRPRGTSEPTFRYVGADYKAVTGDGFVSLGDFGRLDDDGYLYIVDRRTDMIITGGANVYPAEVEHVLHEHPAVVDVAVVGLPDAAWGHRVHAIVHARDGVDPAEFEGVLHAWTRDRLVPYKVPKTWEFVDQLPRTEVGKVSRSRLIEERQQLTTDG